MPALLRALVAPLLIGLAHAMSLSHGPWPWLASTVLAVLLFGAVAANQPQRSFCFAAAGVLMLVFALGGVPGLSPWRLPPVLGGSTLNTGKAIAGLAAMVMLPSRWRWTAGCSAIALLTLIAVPLLAWRIGHVHWAPVTLPVLAAFVLRNALSTLAEEWFFRRWVQEPLQRFGTVAAVLGSAALFGLVHVAGGPVFIGLAALAGVGYALAFTFSGSVWAAVALHLALNALRVALFGLP
jgi:membrane protease YdiL (CAAX protease family)